MGYRVAVLSLCEHGEGGFLRLRDEGRGEKFHEGSHNAEAVDDPFVEPGRSGEARRKFLVQNVVFVAEQAGGGMIGREAARDARELLAFQSAKELANRRRGEDAAEPFVALGGEIGRGAWRGRVEISGGAGSFKKKNEKTDGRVLG